MKYEELEKQYGGLVRRIAAGYTVPGPDREDLEQDIAIAILGALRSFRGESSFTTYCYRIAHNCGIDHIRKRRENPLDPAKLDSTATETTPETQILAKEQHERLAAAVRALPLGLRQPLMLRLDGLPYAEISKILDLSVSNVGVRLNRATRALREMLHP
jgi:RNA polymerase sigma-70 factor, ECF subfamily